MAEGQCYPCRGEADLWDPPSSGCLCALASVTQGTETTQIASPAATWCRTLVPIPGLQGSSQQGTAHVRTGGGSAPAQCPLQVDTCSPLVIGSSLPPLRPHHHPSAYTACSAPSPQSSQES